MAVARYHHTHHHTQHQAVSVGMASAQYYCWDPFTGEQRFFATADELDAYEEGLQLMLLLMMLLLSLLQVLLCCCCFVS